MNQVYFYDLAMVVRWLGAFGLNPFMNQVYFYLSDKSR